MTLVEWSILNYRTGRETCFSFSAVVVVVVVVVGRWGEGPLSRFQVISTILSNSESIGLTINPCYYQTLAVAAGALFGTATCLEET